MVDTKLENNPGNATHQDAVSNECLCDIGSHRYYASPPWRLLEILGGRSMTPDESLQVTTEMKTEVQCGNDKHENCDDDHLDV